MSSDFRFDPLEVRGSGQRIIETAGVNLANRQLIRYNAVGQLVLADASALATLPCVGITLANANAGQQIEILLKGFLGLSTWAWTPGDMLYVSNVAGALGALAGTTAQRVAVVNTATQIWFDPKGLDTGVGGPVCALLEGYTAYVGFDVCKGTNYTNYWTVDGVADDVQIQAAITYVTGLGSGSVFIEEGTYIITVTIQLDDNISLIGADRRTTILQGTAALDGAAATSSIVYINNKDDILIRDLGFDGQNMGGAPYNTGWKAIGGSSGNRITIDHNWVVDTPATGIGVDLMNDLLVINNYVHDCGTGSEIAGSNGIGLGMGAAQGMVVMGNFVDDCQNNGIILEGFNNDTWGAYHLVQGNYCRGNDQAGIRIDGVEYFSVNDNVCKGNVDGIRIGRASWVDPNNESRLGEINDNVCKANSNDGIRVMRAECIDITIEGNQCFSNTSDGIYSIGERVHVLGNTCGDNGAYGVHIGAAAVDNVVKENRLPGNTSGAINDLGTDTATHFVFVPVGDSDSNVGDHPTLVLPDTVDTTFRFQAQIPLEFQQLITAQVIVLQTATGGPPDMQWSTTTDWGKLCAGENYNAGSGAETDQTTAVAQNELVCVDVSASLVGIAAGDLVGFTFIRRGSQAGDTIDADAHYLGFRLRFV